MKRILFIAIALSVPAIVAACDSESTTITCQQPVQLTAQAGAMQSDGSVMVYGSVVEAPILPDGGDLGNYESSVHAVYVALVAAQMGTDQFNFRNFSVQVPADRIAAYNDGTGRAHLPVEAYLAGGCVAQLPVGAEPVVAVPATDAGTTSDASADGSAEGGAPDGG